MTEYEQIVKALQEPFPAGSVVVKGKRAFIPVQIYMARLEDAAKEHWQWEMTDAPQIDVQNRVVTVRGCLTIMDTSRQGIGIGVLNDIEPQSIKTAILTAETEALRDSCDKFLMGWKDLAKHREWGANPGISSFLQTSHNHAIKDFDDSLHSVPPVSNRNCIRCNKALTSEDLLMLSIHNVKNDYCREHIPSQFIKK